MELIVLFTADTHWTTDYPKDAAYVAEFYSSGYHWQDRESPYAYKYICDGTPG